MSTEDHTREATERTGARDGSSEQPTFRRDASGRRRERITPDADPRLSRSMEYGLAILECFSGERPSLGIADLADLIGSSRSTTHRYVSTLVELGYLEQGAKRKYVLAPRASEPGMAVLGTLRLSSPARATLAQLRDQTGCTVGVGVLDHTRALYIDRLPGHRAGQVEIDRETGVGVPLPPHRTALGKALLAGLSDSDRADVLTELELDRYWPDFTFTRPDLEAELHRIGETGLATSDEELAPGSRSIAVLLVDPRLRRPLAVDIVAPASAFGMRRLTNELGPQLMHAAELIAER